MVFYKKEKNKPRFSFDPLPHIFAVDNFKKKKKILGSMTVQLHYGRNLFSYYSLFSCGCTGACTQIFVHLSSSNEHISYPEVKIKLNFSHPQINVETVFLCVCQIR